MTGRPGPPAPSRLTPAPINYARDRPATSLRSPCTATSSVRPKACSWPDPPAAPRTRSPCCAAPYNERTSGLPPLCSARRLHCSRSPNADAAGFWFAFCGRGVKCRRLIVRLKSTLSPRTPVRAVSMRDGDSMAGKQHRLTPVGSPLDGGSMKSAVQVSDGQVPTGAGTCVSKDESRLVAALPRGLLMRSPSSSVCARSCATTRAGRSSPHG